MKGIIDATLTVYSTTEIQVSLFADKEKSLFNNFKSFGQALIGARDKLTISDPEEVYAAGLEACMKNTPQAGTDVVLFWNVAPDQL